jgi:hypothetical protein
VQVSWQEELWLCPLPLLPKVFDVALTRPVRKDCTVSFEGRACGVPFRLRGLHAEVRGCAWVAQIVHDDRVFAEHPRGSQQRLLIDPCDYEGQGDGRVDHPLPPRLDGPAAARKRDATGPTASAGSLRRTGGGGAMGRATKAQPALEI